MALDNLLRPDNRLLGWSTGDFSLYGAQADPAVSFARADAPGAPLTASPPGKSDVPAQDVDGAASAPLLPTVESAPDVQPAGATSPFSAATSPPAAAAAHDPAAIAAPQGGGSTAPGLTAQPTVADPSAPDGRAADSAPGLGSIGGQSFELIAPVLAGLGGVEPGALATVTAQLAQADALVNGVTELVAPVADEALAAVAVTTGALADTLAGLSVDGATTGIGDGLTQAPTLDIDQLIFSGSDPAGGIMTLVGLVQTSELLAVGQAGGAPDAPDASGSIIDDLTGDDALAAPLLGGNLHHGDTAPDPDDLHLGL